MIASRSVQNIRPIISPATVTTVRDMIVCCVVSGHFFIRLYFFISGIFIFLVYIVCFVYIVLALPLWRLSFIITLKVLQLQ